jgi:hypothetical protein
LQRNDKKEGATHRQDMRLTGVYFFIMLNVKDLSQMIKNKECILKDGAKITVMLSIDEFKDIEFNNGVETGK